MDFQIWHHIHCLQHPSPLRDSATPTLGQPSRNPATSILRKDALGWTTSGSTYCKQSQSKEIGPVSKQTVCRFDIQIFGIQTPGASKSYILKWIWLPVTQALATCHQNASLRDPTMERKVYLSKVGSFESTGLWTPSGIPARSDQTGGYQRWYTIVHTMKPNANPARTSAGWCQWSSNRDVATSNVHPHGNKQAVKDSQNRTTLCLCRFIPSVVVDVDISILPKLYHNKYVIPQQVKLEWPEGKLKLASRRHSIGAVHCNKVSSQPQSS